VAGDAPDEGEARAASGRRRFFPLVLLAGGVALTLHLSSKAPHEQHVRLALGDTARDVTSIEVVYVTDDGDVVRTTRLAFDEGKAPRIVALDPELANGDYALRVEIGARGGRRAVERRVKLGGGTTSVDLTAVMNENRAPP
jgi:hypothetical protein